MKKGESISAEELTSSVFSKAQNSIPDEVKSEMLQNVHSFVQKYC